MAGWGVYEGVYICGDIVNIIGSISVESNGLNIEGKQNYCDLVFY